MNRRTHTTTVDLDATRTRLERIGCQKWPRTVGQIFQNLK